ncbi:MAG: hypothetical protein LBP59_00110 [Planctomycetaceae bacterium]|nr:hypothetical protein [Planctomycetaceae bacterium]
MGQVRQIFFVTKNCPKDRRRNACDPSGLQAERLHPRIAGVSPACGCTQPLTSEFRLG